MAAVLVADVEPFPERYAGDPRFLETQVMVLSEAVPAGYWVSVGTAPHAEVVQVSSCDFTAPFYSCKLATRLASPHSAGEPVTPIPDLTD
ncbi:hypothetical protein [Streptacidiphilus anmyonensis]|uniref:hypothetical protein n=1 Tax=Streptacidiphilus anmyonensis TaxID=405782 RepID=UPI0005A5FA57|nr:hypothetical protein [Streptacidiphilus anmyonensis]